MQQSKDQHLRQSADHSANTHAGSLRFHITAICVLTFFSILLIIFGSDHTVRLLYHGKQKTVTEQFAFEINEEA